MADDALSGDSVTIWVAPAGTTGADLADNGKKIQSFITSYSDSGGDNPRESVPVMGGGNVNRKKPANQIEVEFGIILRHTPGITDFQKMRKGKKITPDGTGDDFVVGMVAIQSEVDGSFYYQAYNNVDVTVFETSFDADQEWQGTLRLVASPTDPTGVENTAEGDADITTDLTSWS